MMSEEKYLEFDKKMYSIELLGLILARLIFGIGLIVICWNLMWAIPIWIRIIVEICVGFAFDWIFGKVTRWYIKNVLARISPLWEENYHFYE